MTELANTLSDPAAFAQFVAMVGGMAGLKKLACKMGLSGFAGAALSVKDGAETALRAYELAKELDGITYKSEVANAAPHVAKVMAELVQSLGFSAILRRIKCFAAGTQIVVAMTRRDDGSWQYETKSIEDIRVGDVVLAREELGDTLELRRVLRTVSHSSDHLRVLEFEDMNGQRQTIRTTDEHPFCVVDSREARGRFIPAQHLEVGQTFTGPNGERLTLIASRRDSHPNGIPVYNFEVDGFHTYFVGERATSTPILAHNADCLHHSDPKFMGGNPKQKLTKMDVETHKQLHRDLNDHLFEQRNAAGQHMRPQRNNSGALIRENFPPEQRRNALADFYRKNRDKYPDAARDFFEQHPDLMGE